MTEDSEETQSLRELAPSLGEEVDEVRLHVDYQIIEHFSENLYGSPNKAIEELVANGFDAFATEVQVFVPGPQSPSRVLVWDDGESMSVEGLKKLWWIARSPKDQGERIQARQGRTRKMIGKFGIGKLASYSVGRVISHLCRCQDDFYVVSVDYQEIHGEAGVPVTHDNPLKTPIVRLSEAAARSLVEGLFEVLPGNLDSLFARPTWTLAIVERLKVDDLPLGRLMWVLGNGMPLRPDFSIWVNGEKVEPKLSKKAAVEWDFASPEILDAVKVRWNEHVEKSDPTEKSDQLEPETGTDTLDPREPTANVPYVRLPHLGTVWGAVRLFDETLLKYRSADHGRSHGFFLMVRERLVNPDEAELFLGDPSYGTFYRSQFILHADDLDAELLADRERLRSDQATRELTLLQNALYTAARNRIDARDEERADEQSTKSILPVGSRPFYREPLNALLVRSAPDTAAFDPARPKVERKEIGSDEPIAVMALSEGAFHVNTLHPYFAAIEKRIGKSKATREFLRSFDLFAISERLLEGHLFDLGLDEETVREVVAWREGLFRQLAKAYEGAAAGVVDEMYRTSYLGDKPFEKALQKVFQEMGFVAAHDGKSGKKDVLVTATVGKESFSFIVEAKGSKNDVTNLVAAVGAAASHRDAEGADHAIIVARKFSGFQQPLDPQKGPALIQECQAAGGVSIMEIDAIARVHQAVDRFSYPLPMLRDVFLTPETPKEKLERVDKLTAPTTGFDYTELLEEIWHRQQDEAEGESVPYRSVFQQGRWKKEGMDFPDFERRLTALETLAAGRVLLTGDKEVYLRQAPDLILSQIEKSLRGEGHDIPEDPPHDD